MDRPVQVVATGGPFGAEAGWVRTGTLIAVDGEWWVFDPRKNTPRIARILMAQGREAADVPLIQTFGPTR